MNLSMWNYRTIVAVGLVTQGLVDRFRGLSWEVGLRSLCSESFWHKKRQESYLSFQNAKGFWGSILCCITLSVICHNLARSNWQLALR